MEKTFNIEDVYSVMQNILSRASMMVQSSRYKQDLEHAQRLFFDIRHDEELSPESVKPSDQNNFMTWYLSDYNLEEEKVSPVKFLLDKKGADMNEDEEELATALTQSRLSLYEALDMDEESSTILVRDIFAGATYQFVDPRLVEMAKERFLLGLRIIEWQEITVNVGDLYLFPLEILEQLLMYLKRHLFDPRAIVQPTLPELLKLKGYLFNHIQMAMRKSPPHKKKRETPQDEEIADDNEKTQSNNKNNNKNGKMEESVATVSRSHFSVEDFDKVVNLLNNYQHAEKVSSDSNKTVFYWFKKPFHIAGQKGDGEITVTKRKLLFVTHGQELLDDGKHSLIKLLKPHGVHMYDDLEKRRGFATEKK